MNPRPLIPYQTGAKPPQDSTKSQLSDAASSKPDTISKNMKQDLR
jgi:hypothetical protein